MPTVTLEMATLTTEQKRNLAAEVTEAVARISGLPADAPGPQSRCRNEISAEFKRNTHG